SCALVEIFSEEQLEKLSINNWRGHPDKYMELSTVIVVYIYIYIYTITNVSKVHYFTNDNSDMRSLEVKGHKNLKDSFFQSWKQSHCFIRFFIDYAGHLLLRYSPLKMLSQSREKRLEETL
ncbi:hypothetical protein L9F63_013049, partial [Diploptera punctata]